MSASLSVPDRFALILDGLCAAVAARISGGVMTGALIVLIWARLRRITVLVRALAVRINAGTLNFRRVGPRGTVTRRVSGSLPLRLPRRFGWLLPLVPYAAAGFAEQIRHLLADPQMAALLAATPRMGRLLRPLCRMLGLEAGLLAAPAGVACAEAPVADGGAAADVIAGVTAVVPLTLPDGVPAAGIRLDFGAAAVIVFSA